MEVSSVELHDLETIGSLHVAAFASSETTRLTYPARLRNSDLTSEKRGSLYGEYLAREMKQSGHRIIGHKLTSVKGELVGYAMWRAPITDEKDEEVASGKRLVVLEPDPLFLAERDADAAGRRQGIIATLREARVKGRYWYLLRLCAKSGYERQGIGSQLMQAGLKHIEERDPELPIVLCASPAGKGLYEKFGFASFAEVSMTEPQNEHGEAVPTSYKWDLMVKEMKTE